jgi:DNA-binding NarL/FixJ family response regulator
VDHSTRTWDIEISGGKATPKEVPRTSPDAVMRGSVVPTDTHGNERVGVPGCEFLERWQNRQAMPGSKIRVLSVDDHPLLREGIAAIVNSATDMVMVAQAATGRDAVRIFREHLPDVTLMDLRLPDMSGIDALMAIRETAPEARILMLTTFEGDVEVQRALAAGARGYLLKSTPPEDLLEAVRLVHAGRKRIPADVAAKLAEHFTDELLTGREIEVLRHIAGGNRNRDIAERLSISEETVKVHIRHIMEKLGANDRTQAVTIAVRRGIFQL